jgi:SAM-dependent methyltransferase
MLGEDLSDTPGRLPRLRLVERKAFLLDLVRGRSMLSVGLGGYADPREYSYHLHSADLTRTISGELAAAAGAASFVDISEAAIEAFRAQVDAGYHLVDITSPLEEWPRGLRGSRFDVVVLGEVLEHLDNPGAALRNLRALVAEGGTLVVTVPNAFCLSGVARVLVGRETTHPEHATHHSFVTLHRLLTMSGMPPSEVLWYRWARYGGGRMQRAKRAAAAAVSARLPQLSHGLIAVVRT